MTSLGPVIDAGTRLEKQVLEADERERKRADHAQEDQEGRDALRDQLRKKFLEEKETSNEPARLGLRRSRHMREGVSGSPRHPAQPLLTTSDSESDSMRDRDRDRDEASVLTEAPVGPLSSRAVSKHNKLSK